MAKRNNVSSGAEKTERLTRKSDKEKSEIESLSDNSDGANKRAPAKKATGAKKSGKGKSVKNSKSNAKRAERKKIKEEKKLARKKLAMEKKQKRLERKLAHKEKIAERREKLKEHRAERKEERRKRRDLIKSESKAQRRKRIAAEKKAKMEARAAKREAWIARKKARLEHRQKLASEKRAQKSAKQRAPGFGGWLAAVISLGVTTLALGTVLTFGWISMDGMQADMAGTYTESLYEFNSLIDELDTNLARAEASSSSSDRVKVLSDIAVDSENAETILERFPLDSQTTERLSSFINHMAGDARGMLYTVADGGELSENQLERLGYYHDMNSKIKEQVNSLIESACQSDMLAAMNGKDCALFETFAAIQNNVFGEHTGKRRTPPEITYLEGEEEITASAAEELAKEYFSSYSVTGATCTGEAAGMVSAYNVNLTTDDGEMLVQLTKRGGKVLMFDSYKDCSTRNFSVDRCADIASDFLAEIGYDDLEPVWANEYGTTCSITYAPKQDGAIVYADAVKVKVCEERGIVTGIEAIDYVMRHKDRNIEEAQITEAEAQSSINGAIEVESCRLALIPQAGEETLCYEFFGEMDGTQYYVYVDACTGEELEVKTVVGTAQGNIIK